MCVQMCADVHRCSQRSEEDIGASETEVRSSRELLSVGAGNRTRIGNPGCVVGLMCGHCGLKADRQMPGRKCLRPGCHQGGQAEVSVARTGCAPL